jgi:hypothetical protein
MHGTFEKKHVANKLQTCQEFYSLKMEEGTLVQSHIDKLWTIVDQLINIDHQKNYEDLAFTFLGILSSSFGNLSSSFHTLMVSLSTHINQLFMELVCGQLLQKEL